MHIAIRTDASTRIGLGHLARCRTLAAALCEQGAAMHFICRAHPGHQIDALRAEGYRVSALPAPSVQAAADGDYAAWLGVSQAQDAADTLVPLTDAPAAKPKPDWLIVDHYALDATWEKTLSPAVGGILVIDDLANRRHACDLLLDQNFAPDAEARYADRLPSQTQRLLGPRYALLRPEYAATRHGLRRCQGAAFDKTQREQNRPNPIEPDQPPVRRVLIFFGGTDPDNLSGRALAALTDPTLAALSVDLVVGANNPHRPTLSAQAEARGNTRLHPPRPHLADLMADADLAIGAGGTTTWERCCLGLPSLVVSIAENQRPACAALASAGVIDYLGHQEGVTTEHLHRAILGIIDQGEHRRRLARAGADQVDGLGIERVTKRLLG